MKNRCARCGKRFKKGGPSYRLRAELTSNFDGYIQYNDKTDLAAKIEELNTEMDNMSADEIEKQVYEKFEYIICPECRDEIAKFLDTEGDR